MPEWQMTGKKEKQFQAVIKWILELLYWLAKNCYTEEKQSHIEEKNTTPKLHKWVLESFGIYWKKNQDSAECK